MDMTDTVRTGRCNLEFLSKGLKIKVNIGILHFWINKLKRALTQDIGVAPPSFCGLEKGKSVSDNAAVKLVLYR